MYGDWAAGIAAKDDSAVGDNQVIPARSERFGLQVPCARSRDSADLDLRPKSVARWLGELPLADAQQSAGHIAALLNASNAAELAPPLRFRLAEQLRTPVLSLADSLSREVTLRGFPLPRRALPLAAQGRALLSALTDSYKSIVVQLLAAADKGDPDFLAHSIHRALWVLQRALQFDYELYAPPTTGYWAEVHHLYRLAEQAGIEQRSVVDALHPQGRDSVSLAYRSLVLVALSNPYRLRPDDLSRLPGLAVRYCADIRLEPAAPDTLEFHVLLDSDRPPTLGAPTADARRVDLSAAVRQATRDLREGDNELLRRVLSDWRHPPRRQFGRQPHHGWTRVVFGLDAACWAMEQTGAANRSPRIDGQASMALTAYAPDQHGAAHAGRDNDNSRHFAAALPAAISQGDRRRSVPLPEPVYREHTLATLDVSDEGCCLLWEDSGPAPANADNLLGLWDEVTGRWSIGILRWMQYLRTRGVRLGLQMIAPRAEPARIQRGDRSEPALHLPSHEAQAASLLTGAHQFRVGNVVRLSLSERTLHVRLREILEANRSFVRFAYEVLAEVTSRAHDADDGPEATALGAPDIQYTQENWDG